MNTKSEDVETARAYRYRLYPDSKRQKIIDEHIDLSRKLYNRFLEGMKKAYEKDRTSSPKRSFFNRVLQNLLKENKEYNSLYSQTRQDVRDRLIKAYQNFFRRVKEKKAGKQVKVGFPRFKAKGRYDSITYPQFGFSIDRERKCHMLRITKIGGVKIELHRPIEGTIKTLTIKRKAGQYYAVFSTIKEVEPPKVRDMNPVGIDVGLETFATLSDGRKILKPNFARKKEKRIAHWQRVIARRQKGSHRRDTAKLKLEREWQHINNEANDFIQKTTTELASGNYTSFAFEDLHVQNMLKNHRLSRSIGNAVWSRFIQVLSYKAEEAGLRVIFVDPRNTSQMCSGCGSMNSLSLSDRVFDCKECGYHDDRDINAARNILNRATAGHAGSHARGDLTSTPSARTGQAGSLKREHTRGGLHD